MRCEEEDGCDALVLALRGEHVAQGVNMILAQGGNMWRKGGTWFWRKGGTWFWRKGGR